MRVKTIGLIAAAALSLLSANVTLAQTVPTGAAAAKYNAAFNAWLKQDIWPEARKAGISQKTIESTLTGLSINWKLPDLVIPGQKPPKEQAQSQAEFASPGAYFSEQRLQGLAATGRSLAATHAATLKRIEATYGVPGNILIAVWGRESGFGRAKLPNAVIDVLATKAYTSTRKEMFRAELIDALKIVESGDIPASKMMGSWAGALGQPQFMPSSYLKYAVDFDGDGHRDIWNSVPDALASIANYLSKRGWQRNRDWGFEVSIPDDVSCAQEGPDLARPVADWQKMGIRRISGKAFPSNDLSADGMMLVPAGRNGPEFVVTPNFYVIKEYNNSDLYALFIGNLADRIAYNAGPFQAKWSDVGSMLRSDVLAMQKALVAKGYDVGKADGLAGFKTRRSLGDWQSKNGMRPTCFPQASLKARLK
ncbi:lytic murein transglycosylase [Agrobacterium rubi]|uniref:lytic murein transglycosylase n=1 Tax=Agrobacterium rubi TaxID=28099 RepID=UPI001572717E|nr:lytic murein transglycosylase [Agrobacterium rubi]NTF06045.1 lytic murein transglycosylase [Agrobacterium rubi]NTF18286.1 lytic murein transglycosylase [Agrobacterium rubi]NTF25250.1 lytic murein transglycosylase [Agrobacterium rubi]